MKIMDEIFLITSIIQRDFPEVYEQLEETPLFFEIGDKGLHLSDFRQYLDSISLQLRILENRKDRIICE